MEISVQVGVTDDDGSVIWGYGHHEVVVGTMDVEESALTAAGKVMTQLEAATAAFAEQVEASLKVIRERQETARRES